MMGLSGGYGMDGLDDMDDAFRLDATRWDATG